MPVPMPDHWQNVAKDRVKSWRKRGSDGMPCPFQIDVSNAMLVGWCNPLSIWYFTAMRVGWCIPGCATFRRTFRWLPCPAAKRFSSAISDFNQMSVKSCWQFLNETRNWDTCDVSVWDVYIYIYEYMIYVYVTLRLYVGIYKCICNVRLRRLGVCSLFGVLPPFVLCWFCS